MNNVQLTAEVAALHIQLNKVLTALIVTNAISFFLFMLLPYYFVEKKKP